MRRSSRWLTTVARTRPILAAERVANGHGARSRRIDVNGRTGWCRTLTDAAARRASTFDMHARAHGGDRLLDVIVNCPDEFRRALGHGLSIRLHVSRGRTHRMSSGTRRGELASPARNRCRAASFHGGARCTLRGEWMCAQLLRFVPAAVRRTRACACACACACVGRRGVRWRAAGARASASAGVTARRGR